MSDMARYHPRSPGARLQALRRALWEEDRAEEWHRLWLHLPGANRQARRDADAAFTTATATRMEAERALWEARAGHGLD